MIIKKNKIKQWEEENSDKQTVNKSADFDVLKNDNLSGENHNAEDADEQDITHIDPVLPPEPDVDLFDVENIDFNQRQERRRGTRRRGYRRIDDRNLVSRAQEEAENIKKSAFEEGYNNGLNKANEDLEKFRSNITKFMGATKDVFEYVAPDILELSIEIAKKIIKKELTSDPQVLIETIIDVLKTVSKNEPKINIRVSPQYAQFIKDSLPTVAYQYGIDAKINIIADPSLEGGGCVFQTNNGIVDASIDTQIEIIKKALEGI